MLGELWPTRDPYTVLMLHFDGPNNGTNFVDTARGKVVTPNGNAKIDTSQFVFGNAAGYFDGNGDYLSLADSDDWNFGSGDFTIEFRFRLPSNTPNSMFYAQRVDDAHQFRLGWAGASNGFFEFYVANGATLAQYQLHVTPTANAWHKMVIARKGTNFYWLYDGVLQSPSVLTAIGSNVMPDLAASLFIGNSGHPTYPDWMNGWLEEYRISKGVAWYTENYTLPTEAYKEGVSLLYHLNGNSNDASGNGRNGTDANISYSLANGKFGQGAGFNGSSSKITIGNSGDVNPQIFTFMFALKPSAAGANRSFWGGVGATSCIGMGVGSDNKLKLDKSAVAGICAASVALPTNAITICAITYDALGNAKIYYDGKLVGSATNYQIFTPQTIAIGQENSGNWFNGAMDELAKWNRALPEREIRQLTALMRGKLQ